MLMRQEEGNPDTVVYAASIDRTGVVTLTFVRGTGYGKELAGIGPLEDFAGNLPDINVLSAAVDCFSHIMLDIPKDCRIDFFVVEPRDVPAVRLMSDLAIQLLHGTLLEDGLPLAMDANVKEALVFLNGAADPLMLAIAPDGTLNALSCYSHRNDDGSRIQIESYHGVVLPLRVIHEGRFEGASTFFQEIQSFLFKGGQRREEIEEESAQIVERIEQWFWAGPAARLSDPLIGFCAIELIDKARRAPMKFANGDEETLRKLVEWMQVLDRAREPGVQIGDVSIAAAMGGNPASAYLSSTISFLQAAITPGDDEVDKRTATIAHEIVAWSWPRGEAISSYANNHLSSAVMGPALRFLEARTEEPSAHEAIAAIAGLMEFLTLRGYDQDEIAALTALPSN